MLITANRSNRRTRGSLGDDAVPSSGPVSLIPSRSHSTKSRSTKSSARRRNENGCYWIKYNKWYLPLQ
ncbi:hypothetical protein NDU88_010889 [Pleurodeles waltl]|uniref:Uncharacterized protein n=1 Tax=Pleurodeles waltl TaxID=8319 RepID=A0AAV7PW69_PLEWA|nr:hypothetical protein NDU88_010889 [Pleurodeles waltl]